MTTCRFHVPRRQRGVIGLLGAMVMTLVVVCTALALDTGRLYMEKRNLQRVADLAALSVASRCEYLSACEKAVEYAQDVLADNGYSRELVDSDGITLGRVTLEDVAAEGGTAYRLYGFESASHAQDAVEVVLDRTVSPPLMAALMPDDSSTTLQSTAVARQRHLAAFSVGSSLASLDTADSFLLAPVLEGLLGGQISADIVSNKGVLDASVTLLEIAEEIPGGAADISALTLDAVLDDTELTVADILEATISVLDGREGFDESTQLLDDMLAAATSPERFPLSEVIVVQREGGAKDASALVVPIRVGDLIGTSLMVANRGSGAIELDELSVDVGLPLVGVSGSGDLTVIKPPQLVIGPVGCVSGSPPCDSIPWKTSATSEQVELNLELDIDIGVELPLSGIDVDLAELGLALNVSSVSSEAGLEEIMDSDGGGQYDIRVGAVNDIADVGAVAELSVLSVPLLGLVGDASDSSRSVFGHEAGEYVGDYIRGWPDETGTRLPSNSAVLDSLVEDLSSDLLDPLGEVAYELLSPLINPILRGVIDPVLDASGLGLAVAIVEVSDVYSAGAELVK